MRSRRAPSRPAKKTAQKGPAGAVLGVSAALGVAAVVAVVAVSGSGGGDQTRAAAPGGMAHVHGLAIDPADKQLIAASHFGTFRVRDNGQVEQFGPTQDFMGFSVAGPGQYLASGHPGAEQDGPGNLGLIESLDGGRTWETVALEGKADFHTLEARHGRVYGHSGGVLMVSEDKKAWDTRGSIALADLAVSPQDPDTVLVTTQQGLGLSTDGGRSFQGLPDTPVLVLLSWSEDGTVVGSDPNGGVHVSADGGRTWEVRGSAGGQPAAITADGDDVFVATTDGRIMESDDGGQTFTVRYREV